LFAVSIVVYLLISNIQAQYPDTIHAPAGVPNYCDMPGGATEYRLPEQCYNAPPYSRAKN
jgi:hypothetical protein